MSSPDKSHPRVGFRCIDVRHWWQKRAASHCWHAKIREVEILHGEGYQNTITKRPYYECCWCGAEDRGV